MQNINIELMIDKKSNLKIEEASMKGNNKTGTTI
jgi:hypothetical protein